MLPIIVLILSCFIISTSAFAQIDASKTWIRIAEKAKAAKSCSWSADLELLGQRGSEPGRVLSRAKVEFASAEPGKSFLRLLPEGKDEYWLVSNGAKTWAFVPKLKQYTEEESAAIDRDEEEDAGSSERDLAETYARLVIPTLAGVTRNVEGVDANGVWEVKYEGRKAKWPLVRALSKPDRENNRQLVQLAVDPESGNIGAMIWSTLMRANNEKIVLQLKLTFSQFQIGEPVPDSTFEFEPPKKAKLVDAVPIPGQTGSFLVNQTAPDMELKTLEGEKIRLSDLRGKPVLLNFWASWCGPCRRELPGLTKIYNEYKDKGLIVLGVNDEGKDQARKFAGAASLSFPTLDDSSLKAHRLYRVRSIPSIFMINADGKVVRFISGAREESELRASLKVLGL